MVKFKSAVNKVLGQSDIVLEVLDARFVEQTRNLKLEQKVKDREKILIYVVNKIDLVKSKKVKAAIKKLKPRVEVSIKDHKGIAKLKGQLKRHYNPRWKTNYVGSH